MPDDTFRLTLAQLNPVVGDLAGNAAKAREAITTIETELVKGIDRIVKKLAQQNKGR